MDAGQGRGDVGFGGGHRQAGDEVQVADGGAAQFDGVDRQAAAAFGGEEGDNVSGVGGQAGQLVAGAPRAPGAHPGAVGAPGVVSFGPAGVGVGRQPRRADRAVMRPGSRPRPRCRTSRGWRAASGYAAAGPDRRRWDAGRDGEGRPPPVARRPGLATVSMAVPAAPGRRWAEFRAATSPNDVCTTRDIIGRTMAKKCLPRLCAVALIGEKRQNCMANPARLSLSRVHATPPTLRSLTHGLSSGSCDSVGTSATAPR